MWPLRVDGSGTGTPPASVSPVSCNVVRSRGCGATALDPLASPSSSAALASSLGNHNNASDGNDSDRLRFRGACFTGRIAVRSRTASEDPVRRWPSVGTASFENDSPGDGGEGLDLAGGGGVAFGRGTGSGCPGVSWSKGGGIGGAVRVGSDTWDAFGDWDKFLLTILTVRLDVPEREGGPLVGARGMDVCLPCQ